MLTFEKMRPEERGACAALAARAFGDYDYFTYYIPDDQRRTRFLSTMLEIEVRINDGPADFLTAKDDGEIVAVAMLCPPAYKKPSEMAYEGRLWKVLSSGRHPGCGSMERHGRQGGRTLSQPWWTDLVSESADCGAESKGTRARQPYAARVHPAVCERAWWRNTLPFYKLRGQPEFLSKEWI